MLAEFGGLAFDENAVDGFTVASFDGWDDGPTPRMSVDLIPGGDGGYEVTRTYLAPRVLTLAGLLLAGEGAQRLASRFRGIQGGGAPQTLAVTDRDGRWNLLASVDEASLRPIVGSLYAYSLTLIARDPVKYADAVILGPAGLPTQSGGLVLPSAFPWSFGESVVPVLTVLNDGSVPVLPRVTVTGSASSVVVHGGPRRVEFGAFAGTLVIDSLERRAWLNGSDVTRSLVRRDWHSVPAGESQAFSFDAVTAAAGTSMTVEYRIGAW